MIYNLCSALLLQETDAGPDQMKVEETDMPNNRINSRLNDAINDVNAVYSGKDPSGLYAKVNEASSALRHLTDPYYEQDSILTDDNIESILKAYDNLLTACDDYIRNAAKSPSKGYEKGRLHCIQALRGIITEDMHSLNEATGVTGTERTLMGLIQQGRSIKADVNDPAAVNTVGGSMSARMPIRLKLEDGTVEEGFFTENNFLTNYTDKMEQLKRSYMEKLGQNSMSYEIADRILSHDFDEMNVFYGANHTVVRTMRDPEAKENAVNKISDFMNVTGPYLTLMTKPMLEAVVQDPPDNETLNLRRNLIDVIKDVDSYTSFYRVNVFSAKLPVGENVDKRNTAMSTVANYLGLGNIIAGARPLEVRIGNETKTGTFQQKAVGSDFGRLKADDDLLEIGRQYEMNNYEAVDSPELTKQVSDLMALDYICGNTDRHMGNMLYQTEKLNGKVRIKGIKGIDNDMSFGNRVTSLNSPSAKMVNPEDMCIMRRITAERILDLTTDRLDLLLKDMNFTKNELNSCHERLRNLQNKLKLDMGIQKEKGIKTVSPGRILVVDDEKFKDYPIESLGVNDPKKKNRNYFDKLKELPKVINARMRHENIAKQDTKIKYVDATAESGTLNFVSKDTRTDIDVEKTAEKLRIAKETFDRLGSKWFSKDTAHYQWMKQSVKQLAQKFDNLKKTVPQSGVVEIPKAEAIRIEALFRQISLSSANYERTHPNPRTSSGKNRLAAARALKNLKVVNGKEKDIKVNDGMDNVKKTSLKDLIKLDDPAHKAPDANKERKRSKSVNIQNTKRALSP